MPSDLPVVILKLRPYPLHAGSIGIARSIGRLGADIHVIGEREGSPLARSRYVQSVAALASSDASPEQLARRIQSDAPPGGALLVPVDDDGAIFVQQYADILQNGYRFPRLADGLVHRIVDKAALSELARSAGVPSPRHAMPATLAELETYLADATFPVVVKRREPGPWSGPATVRSVEIAKDAETVRDLWLRHLVDGRPNCVLQEYIPGGAETVWMVNAYVDGDSTVRFAASGRKLRQSPPSTGATSLGICERNDEVINLTTRLVRHIGYRGIVDIGWRFDKRDGEYKLLDFNPRIGATFRLFVGNGGMDVLRACYLDLTGQSVAADEVTDGRKWMNEGYDAHVAAGEIASGKLTIADYVRSCRGVTETTWWARDDVGPALSMVTTGSHRLLSRGVTKARTRFRQPRPAVPHVVADQG
jgi:D-aspartate ligase